MKEVGTAHWMSPNTGATNSSDFTALPGGRSDNTWNNITQIARFWSSSQYSGSNSWSLWLWYTTGSLTTNNNSKNYGYSLRCMKAGTTPLTTVTTDAASNIAAYTATSGGTVTLDGGDPVIARGVCWNTSSGPTTANSYTTDGSGTGTFISSLTGLTPGTLYYVRAYATNSMGTIYGNEVSFCSLPIACPGIPTVTYEGKTYNTVEIGTQCWLKENLNVGTKILGTQDQQDNSLIEKYCYDDLETNCDTYGGLYQWDELMQYVTTAGAGENEAVAKKNNQHNNRRLLYFKTFICSF